MSSRTWKPLAYLEDIETGGIGAHAQTHEYGGTDIVTNLDHLKIRGTTIIDTDKTLKKIKLQDWTGQV
jgi:hypothetical protein